MTIIRFPHRCVEVPAREHGIEAQVSSASQQARRRTAALSISAGNSELEPDDRQEQRSGNFDRQGGEGREVGRCAALLAGGLQCSKRDVRRKSGSAIRPSDSAGRPEARKSAALSELADDWRLTIREIKASPVSHLLVAFAGFVVGLLLVIIPAMIGAEMLL